MLSLIRGLLHRLFYFVNPESSLVVESGYKLNRGILEANESSKLTGYDRKVHDMRT